ncbi:hypothetical protein B5C34_10565 [Pacificimonas flava]|uniref:Peptidase M28 domain-containing protein n=2 Tax=Pacificimonas TaxID=1960290 RepID=A0A219B676_9SPHN|nr:MULTISPECIES: M20/M25/M40 family metallo-hydrolase [Pacificimonas]MBZ6378888.1 M20/M25/M40 family metallo-hydrolase [Pacificimonas aurantium]OWV33860.1 hypothetical protein B5C34_10565 [Pacificimonas flava]
MAKLWAPVLALLLGLLLALFGTASSVPQPEDSPASGFSSGRAMRDVGRIASEPHVTASEANLRVAEYLQGRLSSLGLTVSTQVFELPDRSNEKLRTLFGSPETAMPPTNIIGTWGDVNAGNAVLLMAHYDSAGGSPGAADDAAGVAAILETLRALSESGAPPERGLVVLFTDAEEIGLAGARSFFAEHPLADRIEAIINLEARGSGGRATLFQTSARNGEAIRRYAEGVSRPGASSAAAFVYSLLPNDTDLTPALERDYTAYNFAFIGRPGLYHSPLATPETLDEGSVQDMGDQLLALTCALLDARPLPPKAENITFFDAFGLFLIHYPTWAGWVLLVLAAGLHLAANERASVRAAGRRMAGTLAVALGGGGMIYLLNLVSGADGPVNYYDRLAAIPAIEVMSLLALLAVLALSVRLWNVRVASLAGLVCALALQILAPTVAYFAVWPMLLGGAALAATKYLPGAAGRGAAAVCSALVIGFLLQNGHWLMQGVGPDMPWTAALLAAMSLPALAAVLPPEMPSRPLRLFAGLCLILALGMAVWIRLDPIAETAAVYSRFG